MYNYSEAYLSSREFYERQGTDDPFSLMGFRGEFTFSDHSLVPELIQTYVLRKTKYERFRQVPLELVNTLAREIHGGEPGVPLRILDSLAEMAVERARLLALDATSEKSNYTPELTIDDWSAQGNAPDVAKEERTDDAE